MSTVKLRNINPVGQVDVPLLGRQGEPYGEHGTGCLEPDEVFEVDRHIAGRAPTYDADGNIVDYGKGLLAQVGNYELAVAPAEKKTPAKRRRPKRAAAAPPAPPVELQPAETPTADATPEA